MQSAKTLKQLVEICRKSGYFEMNANKNVLSSIKYLPLGRMLQESIKKQWHKGIGSKTIFLGEYSADNSLLNLNGTSLQDRFKIIQKEFQCSVPFGVAEQFSRTLPVFSSLTTDISILPNTRTYLNYSYFTNSKKSKEEFYKITRQRKIWWMKVNQKKGLTRT